MSLPSFPDSDNTPTREQVINQILSSIAMEELGLSHIINSEGEKLQFALGTIPGADKLVEPLTLENLLDLNKSVQKTLDSTMMNQFFLRDKMSSALSASTLQGPTGPTGGAGTIEVGAVTPVPYGSPLEITNSGTAENAILDFNIPEGRPGTVAVDSFGIHAELHGDTEVQLPDADPILFNATISDTGNGITYNSTTGEFSINQVGNFLINWHVAVDGSGGADPISFSVYLNDNRYSTALTPDVTGQVSGSAFVIVTAAPATITLRNSSNAPVTLVASEVKAIIVITGINVQV